MGIEWNGKCDDKYNRSKKQIVLFNLLILYKNKKTKIDDLYNYRMNIGTWCYCKKC